MDKDHMDYMHLRPWTPLFRYPHDDAAGIVVTRADYECLLPEAPLNRTAVEFGLRLMVADVHRSPLGLDQEFGDIARDKHAFSTDWFSMLSQDNTRGKLKADSEAALRAYARVERWTRGVDVFAKKFLLVPVFEDQHWSLAIICHPGVLARRALARRNRTIRRAVAELVDAGIAEAAQLPVPHVDDSESESESDSDSDSYADKPRPCVIHMDSLRKHSAKKIEKWLRCFLEMEWRKRHADKPPFTLREPADLLLAMPKVPQQQMYSGDSGIYTLKYVQCFLARAVCGDELKVNARDVCLCFRDHDWETGFNGNGIKEMRRSLKDLVRVLQCEEDHRRFRARRRLCWIGQRDPGSPLSRLPMEILRKLVPYFSLPDFYV
jgi:Ulp1 family protease